MKQNKNQKNTAVNQITEGVIWKVLLTFAVPIILTNVIQQLYSMVDLIVAGKYIGAAGTIGVSTGGELSDFLALSGAQKRWEQSGMTIYEIESQRVFFETAQTMDAQ